MHWVISKAQWELGIRWNVLGLPAYFTLCAWWMQNNLRRQHSTSFWTVLNNWLVILYIYPFVFNKRRNLIIQISIFFTLSSLTFIFNSMYKRSLNYLHKIIYALSKVESTCENSLCAFLILRSQDQMRQFFILLFIQNDFLWQFCYFRVN